MGEAKINEKSLRIVFKLQNTRTINQRSMRQAFFKIGKDLIKTANGHILDKNKTGILYGVVIRNGKKRLVKARSGLRTHRASAPGQSPANLNSDLRRSLQFQIRGSNFMEFFAETPYASRLEKGDNIIKKRPYMFKSAKENLRNMQRHFFDEFKKEFKRARV